MHITEPTIATIEEDSAYWELDTILIKVASRCNINCNYCYVFNMGDDNFRMMEKIMTEETIQAVVTSLKCLSLSQSKLFSVILHGGEPLLLGPKRLEFLLRQLRKVLPYHYPISIQSNGILINSEILNICSLYHTSIAISLDGPKHIHDKERVEHTGAGTFEQVMTGYEMLKQHPDSKFLNAGLLAVIDPLTDPSEVYSFFKSVGAPSVDFLFKDGNHSRLPADKKSFASIEYGKWTSDLLRAYLADPDPLPIRVLDDLIKVLLGGRVSKEGVGVSDFGILIIDTDGSLMKNDTLKSVYNGADKFEKTVNVKDNYLLEFLRSEEFKSYRKLQQPTDPSCLSCPSLSLCGGGMILHRWKDDSGFHNPSVYCQDMLFLIDTIKTQLKIHLPNGYVPALP